MIVDSHRVILVLDLCYDTIHTHRHSHSDIESVLDLEERWGGSTALHFNCLILVYTIQQAARSTFHQTLRDWSLVDDDDHDGKTPIIIILYWSLKP